MQRCERCVTPRTYPGTTFDESGVCSHCRTYERQYVNWEAGKAERKRTFERILKTAKRKRRPYDVLVPLSGGKDSTYVLFLATKVYRLRVLCYTFDNGFQSQTAKDNIRAAIEASGADHFVFRPDREMLMRLYRHFLEKTGMFCPVCMRGISAGIYFVSQHFNIPVVFGGSSARTEERLVPEIFQDGDIHFFKNVLRAHPVSDATETLLHDRTMKDTIGRVLFILSRGRIMLGRTYLYAPDYFEWEYDHIYSTIQNEMGWKPAEDRDEHVDCLADPIVHFYVRETRVPELTASTLRYSSEIRAGQMPREKALRVVEEEHVRRREPTETREFLNRVGITKDQLIGLMQDGKRHMQYQEPGLMRRTYQAIRRVGILR